MAAGLLVYDLLLLAFAVGLWGGAGWVGARVHAALAPFGPWLAIPAALLAGLLAAILAVGALGLLTPRPDAGRVELMKGRRFWAWLIRSLYRRVLLPGPLKPIVFTFNTLRFLALRALGARVAFSANMSTDVELLAPPLLEVGPGATIGARCMIAGHYVDAGKLRLEPVRVEKGALLAAEVLVGPGVVVGEGARVLAGVKLGPGTRVGAGAVIEAGVRFEGQSVVAPGVRVPAGTNVLRGVAWTEGGEQGGVDAEEGGAGRVARAGGDDEDEVTDAGALA